ncbi:MAG TPA: hypothetical protein VKT18_05550, partial [Acidimicrobiales bacterium]|nr:hypothetical protein [Acidimicrobiales bacterium]
MSALPGRASRGDGGVAARRAVLRWSLRTFRREWRQQILICALIALAVAGTIFGAGIISGSQVPQNVGFGTANEISQLAGNDPHLAVELAALRHHFGPTSVIESEAITTGTAGGATIESFDTHGPFVGSMLQVTEGRLPKARDEVDLTSALAGLYSLHVGDTWSALGTTWHVVGEVAEPTDLNADLALAVPGAIANPTSVTTLFDATPARIATFVPPRGTYSTLVNSLVPLPPAPGLSVGELIILVAATFGMLFIGLIAVAGFTVMAHRRTRAIGMLGALGASDS